MARSTPSNLRTDRAAVTQVVLRTPWFLLSAVLVYYALFRLPFLFPPKQQLMSASYAFGFNNGVAILAMVALLGGITLLYLARPGRLFYPPIIFQREPSPTGRQMLMLAFSFAAVFYAGLTFAMYVYNVRAAPWLMWETRHLLHRAWLMEAYGLSPYTQFQTAYGPVLTYAPVWLHLLLRPFGASIEQAYFVSHLLFNLAGLWCAYYVLSRAVMPAHARVVSFSILAVAGFAPYMGFGGVLIRYFLPFASVLLGHYAVVQSLSRGGDPRYWVGTAVIILLLVILNILVSSEVGVAFAIAWLGYAVLTAHWQVRILIVSLIALMGAIFLCWLVLPASYYWTLLQTSQGVNNLPLLPAPHVLLYAFTLLIIVPPLLAPSLRRPSIGDVCDVAVCGALGLLCVAMSPGALGRCDPPHVLFYGIGASMLLMILVANISAIAFIAYTTAYVSVFIIVMQAINLQVFYHISPQMLISTRVAAVTQKLRAATGTAHVDNATLSKLDRYPRLGLPFASFGDPSVEKYVLARGALQPEYYVCILNVGTAADLERKLKDVMEMEYVLVPSGLTLPSTTSAQSPCTNYLKSLQEWFLYPAKLRCRADPLDPMSSVQSLIADHFTPVEKIDSWLVLRRISGSRTAR